MSPAVVVDLETIKHRLHGRLGQKSLVDQNTASVSSASLPEDTVGFLLKALEHTDKAFAQEIETLLYHCGTVIVPELLEGLLSAHPVVRATCAMVLIRFGVTVLPAVQTLATKHSQTANIQWIADFIAYQLGQTIQTKALAKTLGKMQPKAIQDTMFWDGPLPVLEKVG